jgi:hypothetical protein
MFADGGSIGRARSEQGLEFAECGGDRAAIVNHSRSVADQFRPPDALALGRRAADNPDGQKETLSHFNGCVWNRTCHIATHVD